MKTALLQHVAELMGADSYTYPVVRRMARYLVAEWCVSDDGERVVNVSPYAWDRLLRAAIRPRSTPAQDSLVSLLLINGPTSRYEAATEIGPNHSTRYGYRTIERAVAAGRVRLIPHPNGKRGECYVEVVK